MADQQNLRIKSPLLRKQSIVSNSSLNSPTKLTTVRKSQDIDSLLNRFSLLDKSIEIDVNKANFNLINYELDSKKQKIKYDPQMMSAKLRQLQNKAQIDRANMEINNRQKKRHHFHNKKKQNLENQTYKKIYQKFIENHDLYQMPEYDSDDQLDQKQKIPNGIKYYQYLKKHPKIIEYTLQKQYFKSKKDQIKKAQTIQIIQQMKKTEGKPGLFPFYQISKTLKSPQNSENNPQKIVDSQYHKFFTKKRNDKLADETKQIDRCTKMLDKQSQIINDPQNAVISKQNKKKMQRKFNEIVNQIARSEKKQKENMRTTTRKRLTLPKIDDFKSVSLKKCSMLGSTDTYF